MKRNHKGSMYGHGAFWTANKTTATSDHTWQDKTLESEAETG